MVDQLSCRTRALARVPSLWTSCTGTHTLVSKALGVDQLSRATRALVRGPPCRHGFPGDSHRARRPGYRTAVPCDARFCPRAPGVNQRSRPHGPVSESPRGRPPVPGDSGRYPRAHSVDQLSRASRFLVQGPALTSCPGRIVPGSAASGVDQTSGGLGPGPEGPRGRLAVPGDSGLAPRAGGFDQVSRGTGARSKGPAWSTSCPRRLGTLSEGPRFQTAFLGVSGPCPRARSVLQLSRATRTVPEAWVSTRCPWRPGPMLRARGGDHVSQATWAPARGPAG